MILVGLRKEQHIFKSLISVFFLSQVNVKSGSSVPLQTVRNGGGFVGTLTPLSFQLIGPVTRIQVWNGNVFFFQFLLFLPEYII